LLWPAIWPLSLKGLGGLTSKGSALLIMGVIGGGLVPLLYGAISDAANPHIAYSVLIPLYLFILYFSVAGYKGSRV
jgi:fucose permease